MPELASPDMQKAKHVEDRSPEASQLQLSTIASPLARLQRKVSAQLQVPQTGEKEIMPVFQNQGVSPLGIVQNFHKFQLEIQMPQVPPSEVPHKVKGRGLGKGLVSIVPSVKTERPYL